MPKSGDLAGGLVGIRQELEAAGVTDMDALWQEIGGGSRGLDDFSQATLIPRQALIGRLISYTAGRGQEKGRSWPRRHTFDLVLLAACVLFGWLVWRAAPRAHAVGIALRDLPAGERISAAALFAPHPELSAHQSLKSRVAKGGYVFPESLEPVPVTVKDQYLHGLYRLSLRVERTDIDRLSEVPTRASLAVCSPGGKAGNPQTRFLRNIPIVAVDRARGDSTVTVALQESE